MEFQENGDTLRCLFQGDLNSLACRELEPAIAEHVAEARKKHAPLQLVFDLAQSHFVTSAFIRICIAQCKVVGIQHFRIEHADEEVKGVFEIAGLTEMMRIN